VLGPDAATAGLLVIVAVALTFDYVALAFDYTNGFHDAANAIATSVSTGAVAAVVYPITHALLG